MPGIFIKVYGELPKLDNAKISRSMVYDIVKALLFYCYYYSKCNQCGVRCYPSSLALRAFHHSIRYVFILNYVEQIVIGCRCMCQNLGVSI